jgi:hypothetical protein
MLNPSRALAISLALAALAGLVLGLATDVGLLGWAFAALTAIYLGTVGLARLAVQR